MFSALTDKAEDMIKYTTFMMGTKVYLVFYDMCTIKKFAILFV